MQMQEPVWLSPEEAAKTNAYFRSLAHQSPIPAVAVQALFGRCCLATFSDSGSTLGELASDASGLGRAILTCPEPDKLGLDPLLLIEIYSMLQAAGESVDSLDQVLSRVVSELTQQSAEIQSMGRVRSIASALAPLGYPIAMAKPAKQSAVLLRSPEQWFDLSLEALADLADHLLAERRDLDDFETKILSLIALSELRNYRVDVACKLLRVVSELGLICPESTEGLNFIALQRRRGGYYGFSNQFAEPAGTDADKHMSLYLPLTLNTVWLFKVETVCRQRLQALVGV